MAKGKKKQLVSDKWRVIKQHNTDVSNKLYFENMAKQILAMYTMPNNEMIDEVIKCAIQEETNPECLTFLDSQPNRWALANIISEIFDRIEDNETKYQFALTYNKRIEELRKERKYFIWTKFEFEEIK